METGDLNPAALPPGSRVGPWRVLAPQGRGTYGVVYRAVAAESEASSLVALKLALYPRDERFAREAELLRRVLHPAVPRLLDAGDWLAPSGTPHPYLAMQLIEGAPLYDWAWRRLPSSRQALLLLASLARALAATHAAGGLHRDVKGGNVLVRASDGQPFLTDFGCGHYLGASTLTWQLFPPGTPAYRSPEAWRYVLRANSDSAPSYPAGPADDVFALGVTAFRLLTGVYPPSTNPEDDESRVWHQDGTGAPPVRELNARCCEELGALVRRMLHVRPEARGSARELAEALEQAARMTGPEAEVPLFERDAPRPVRVRALPRRVAPRATGRGWLPWLTATSVGGALAFGVGWAWGMWNGEESAQEPVALRMEEKDGGTAAVGDSALTAPVAPAPPPSEWSAIALEVPPKPFPGQRRPDANGRCPGRAQVPIHGGCWIKAAGDLEDCDEGTYLYKGACYVPVFPPPRPPISSPARSPDSR